MADETDITPIVYTIDQAATLLQLNRTSIYDAHHEGRLTIRKIGSKSVILKTEIDAMLANNEMPRDPTATRKARMARNAAKKAAVKSADNPNGAPMNGAD